MAMSANIDTNKNTMTNHDKVIQLHKYFNVNLNELVDELNLEKYGFEKEHNFVDEFNPINMTHQDIDLYLDRVMWVLTCAYCESLQIFIKYANIFSLEDIGINPYNHLMQTCLESNFGDICKRELQVKRFNEIIETMRVDMNHITYAGPFLSLTSDQYFIDMLIKYGSDVNLVFNKDQTVLSELFYKVLYELSYTNRSFEKVKYLLEKGAYINLGNIHTISGVQYEDRSLKIEFIKYLIRNGLDTNDHKLTDKKYLYETRLGKLIQKLVNENPQ